jgi:YHS domain-containing protein
MKQRLLAALAALTLLAYACATIPKPSLGKVVDGYLVNVDSKGVILEGHDPVSLREGKDLAGNPAINTRYHGAIYHFASEANKKKFLTNPTEYEPEFGGYCAYGVAVGNLAPIELWTYDTTFQHRNLYQHNQKAVNGWKKDIPGNYTKAREVWAGFEQKFAGKRK